MSTRNGAHPFCYVSKFTLANVCENQLARAFSAIYIDYMSDIKAHFTKTVGDYDTVANHVVFKNDELHQCLVDAISFDLNRELKVLDLGCGTGHGMNLIAAKFPNASLTGVDFSPRMIAKSKEKLQPFVERVELIEGDFTNMDFGKSYDVVVSAVAIHNCTHEQKTVLFKKIFNSLNDGGIFVNGDFYEHKSPVVNKKLQDLYRKFLTKNLKEDELEVWLHHAFEEDMPMELGQQCDILENLGFKSPEILWLYNNEAVYSAQR